MFSQTSTEIPRSTHELTEYVTPTDGHIIPSGYSPRSHAPSCFSPFFLMPEMTVPFIMFLKVLVQHTAVPLHILGKYVPRPPGDA